jgi:hypothetical protein
MILITNCQGEERQLSALGCEKNVLICVLREVRID